MNYLLASTKALLRVGAGIGQGGEGSVHEITGAPQRVVKLYSRDPTPEKVAKLAAMVGIGDAELLKIAAWPVDLVIDSRGATRGFVMPRIASRSDVHELYSPKSRAQEFPETDFRFLIHVATNISRAIAIVHKHRHVIGDINHGSVLVGRDGTAMLIDCDSIQITSNGRTFTCDVGVPLFTPPELHDKPFRGVVRTPNHDAFGMAVMIFQLLFMGRHPFAGKFLGRGDMPIEQAIKEFRFAYGADRRANQMETPPYTVGLSAMGFGIARLFEEAFGRGGVTRRPTALQWIAELEGLAKGLKHCTKNSTHYYPEAAGSCLWCPIEQATYSRLFGQRIIVTSLTGAVRVDDLWAAIAAIRGPGAAPPLPTATPPTRGVRDALLAVRKLASLASVCAALVSCSVVPDGGVFLGAGGLLAAYFLWPRVSDTARSALSQANRNWEAALVDWNQQAGEQTFLTKRRELEALRNELADLPNERTRRFRKLQQEREQRQREAYLDRFRIDRARIPLIGEARVAMLASYGVETAADVSSAKIVSIPGFGETLASNIMTWRRDHEKNFRFNPNEPVNPKDIAAMDRDLQARQTRLMTTLREGPVQLRRLGAEIVQARIRLRPRLEEAWMAKQVADMNARV